MNYKQIVGFALLGVAVVAVGVYLGGSVVQPTAKNLGIAVGEPSYRSAVMASTTCGTSITSAATVDATNTARSAFLVNGVVSGTSVWLCRTASSTCTTGAGLLIQPSSTQWTPWEQTDAYIGPYSCISTGPASSVIHYWVSPTNVGG